MNLVQGLSDRPKQETSLVLADGTKAVLNMEYRSNQLGWFASVSWGDFLVSGLRLVTFPNILRDFRKKIPFGLAISTTGGVEPLNQTDFADGTATVLLLDAADVAEVESTIFSVP